MSADLRLRPAAEADQARVRELVHKALLNPLDLDWRRFVVAEAGGGGVIGCGQIRQHRDGSRELGSLVVAADWRGRGVGRALIEHLMHGAAPPLWLTCRSGMTPLYERFGFRAVRDPESIPPYFRRLRRVAGVFGLLAGSGEALAIMVWDGHAAASPAQGLAEEPPRND